jgi:peptidoglycan biosynthesis protein MviN/MurJ (putative lipid II flippase)
MLNKKDLDFIEYWKNNRDREKRTFRQLCAGLPVGAALAIGILASVFSGWYTRAEMVAGGESSPTVIMIAIGIIVVFVAIFYKKHQWDQNEEHYQELLYKKKKEENLENANV